MARLLLVDSYNLVMRGGLAKAMLEELPYETAGMIGFCRRVFNHIIYNNITHLCCSLDGLESNYTRKSLDCNYKINRKEKEAFIQNQLEQLPQLCNILKFPFEQVKYYEADDIIYTYTNNAINSNKFDRIDIISPDKCLYQLLTDNRVNIYKQFDTVLSSNNDIYYKIPNIDIEPNKVVDYLSLVGHRCNNIKGCNNIGPKKAIWLLNNYNDLDDIYNNVDTIKNSNYRYRKSITKNLEQNKNEVYKSKEVLTLHMLKELKDLKDLEYRNNFEQYTEYELKDMKHQMVSELEQLNIFKYLEEVFDQFWLKNFNKQQMN